MEKALFSGIAIAITLYVLLDYIRSILKGGTRPHVFSWVIWGVTTLIVFFAQYAEKGGLGALPNGVSGIMTIVIAGLAYWKRGDITITRSDWCFFFTALATLPLWYLTANPLYTVIILTLVDLIGYLPTVRKSYHLPYAEPVGMYAMMNIRNLLAIAALEHYSLTTLFFPVATSVANFLLIQLILRRRKTLESTQNPV